MVFWKEIHALFHFWWLSGYSNPSALCGQTWSLDKPPLKTMWIFMHTPPPFYFKNIGIFFNFWIQSLHKIDSSIQMFVLDLLIPNCLVFTFICINLGQFKIHMDQCLRPPSPMWIYMVIWRTPPPPLVIHMVYGCSLIVFNVMCRCNLKSIKL